MQYFIALGLMALSLIGLSPAQNVEGSMDDRDRIAVTPVLPRQAENISATIEQNLFNRLQRVATLEGIGASSQSSRFLMVTDLDVITKDVTPTAPPMVSMQIDLSLTIMDFETSNTFSSVVVPLKGVGRTETKAMMQALKGLSSDNQDIRSFLAVGKRKILEYYNSQCDFIIERARTLAANQEFERSLHQLMSVPEVSRDCYFRALDESKVVFDQYQDFLCDQNLQKARAVWAANPNARGANAVAPYLADIQPSAACYEEAQGLVQQISSKVLQDEQRDWDFKMKVWDDQVDLREQEIEATRQIGVAYGSNQPNQVINLVGSPYRRFNF
jgi:hypothetical protein